jgi:hypothetical protein
MKKSVQLVPVYTMQFLADLSAKEFADLVWKRWNSDWPCSPSRCLPAPRGEEEVEPYYFVKTSNGEKEFKLPPKVTVVLSGGNN